MRNTLSGTGVDAPSSPRNAAQGSALALLCAAAAAACFGSPSSELDGHGALPELLSKTTHQADASSTVPLEVSALALPAEGFCPIALAPEALDVTGPTG